MYMTENSTLYPFPNVWTAKTWINGLHGCFYPWEETAALLDALSARAESYPWPHLPQEVNKAEVSRFLDDFEHNATTYPDMLALVFAALATVTRRGVYDKNGDQWVPGLVEASSKKGDLFGK